MSVFDGYSQEEIYRMRHLYPDEVAQLICFVQPMPELSKEDWDSIGIVLECISKRGCLGHTPL